jgi:hypothetical protein
MSLKKLTMNFKQSIFRGTNHLNDDNRHYLLVNSARKPPELEP